eukprot:COSAG03_NODE_531_length_7114_cov_467.466714_4_plen_63_part_00
MHCDDPTIAICRSRRRTRHSSRRRRTQLHRRTDLRPAPGAFDSLLGAAPLSGSADLAPSVVC